VAGADVGQVVDFGDDEALDAVVEQHEDRGECGEEDLEDDDGEAEGDGGGPAGGGVRGEEDAQDEKDRDGDAGEDDEHTREHEEADEDGIGVDRDAAEAVDDEGGEVHLGFAGIAAAAVDGDGGEWEAGTQDGGGEVVPEVGDHDQAVDVAAGEQGEVAEADGLAGDELEEAFVEEVEEFEGAGFDAFFALGDDAEVGAAGDGAGEGVEGVGRILAVGVHDEEGVEVGVVGGDAEADGDGALVADVDGEVNDLDAGEVGEGGEGVQVGGGVFGGTVVDGADEELEGQGGGDLVELGEQEAEG
jgi:hypothetical protein